MLLPDSDGARAREVADRVARAVSERIHTPEGPITLSVGAAVFGDDGHTLDDLVPVADEALYAAKLHGRAVPESPREPRPPARSPARAAPFPSGA
jgi:GGDEF domain-containing protein